MELIALLVASAIASQAPGAPAAEKVLADAHYRNVRILGEASGGCASMDPLHLRFSALDASGRPSTGTVCGNLLAPPSLHLDE